MSTSMFFTADHHGFYQNGRPFFPLIQEAGTLPADWSNTVVITLAAGLKEDLDWSSQMDLAQKHIALGKFILWEIDLGLNQCPFDPQDSAAFFSFSLALEEFSAKIWLKFSDQTLGVILYRGTFDPAFSFPFSKWELPYLEWLEEKRGAVPHWHELKSLKGEEYPLYSAQNFAEYLHRLVSFLPDLVLPFVVIDVSAIPSCAKIAQLFSKERFEHTHLILRGMQYPFSGITWNDGRLAHGWMGLSGPHPWEMSSVPLGIYLPKDLMIDSSILAQIDKLIASLNEKQTLFRIIPEEKLTEQWDGLDRLIVPAKAVSVQGKRKLLGFIAAGGTVETFGEPIGLPDEVSISF